MEPNVNGPIVQWYRQQVVFLTGGSGFLGKAFLFKLLQCKVPRIYVLIRPKKGQGPEERLDKLLREEIFESLTEGDPQLRTRLIAVEGDITEIGLGLSQKDRTLLQDDVTLVFHAAASVKMDDSLKKAVHHNLRSTRDVVDLAKGMKKLKMLQYISTAFSNYEATTSPVGVEEKLYERKMDWEKLIEFVDSTSDEIINAVELKLIGASPNTYIFTKHLAEAVIQDAASFLPVVITRPPVVTPSLKEPLPGWLENLSSPVAFTTAAGKGVLRVLHGELNVIKSYSPVDICINGALVASWFQTISVRRENETSRLAVYNIDYTPVTSRDLGTIGESVLIKRPMHNGLWTPHYFSLPNHHTFLFGHLLLHFLPGLILDSVLLIVGQKPRLTKIYRKIYNAMVMLHPILNTSDNFDTRNFQQLKKIIPEQEKDTFSLDVPRLDEFPEYVTSTIVGIRKLFGEPPYPTKEDYQHQKRLLWLERILITLLTAFFIWRFSWKGVWDYSTSAICSYLDSILIGEY